MKKMLIKKPEWPIPWDPEENEDVYGYGYAM